MNLAMPSDNFGGHLSSAPTSLILKLALGEAPADTPVVLDVNQRHCPPGKWLDGGPIDRIITQLAGGVRIARLHPSLANCMCGGVRHRGYDETEHLTGIARTFIVRVAPGTPIDRLCEKLTQVRSVETASPNYLTSVPFEFDSFIAERDDAAAMAPRNLIRAPQALAAEPGDASILLGLIDSGVATNHTELLDRFRAGYDTVRLTAQDVAPGISLLGDHLVNDGDPTDSFVGHGMACAGIIGAVGHQMPAGLGGATRIIPMRALGAAKLPGKIQPVGLGAIADLDMAVTLAVNLGAKVINMSFGTDDRALPTSSPRPHADVIDYATERGCILVAASGNNGETTKYWPAAFPRVIAVGAVDNDARPAGFSTRGNHVSLCAPGVRVMTTSLAGYQYATGTSFAAPFVAATAALLVSRAARRAMPVTGADVKEILIKSVRPFATGTDFTGCGSGVLDAAAALSHLDEFLARTTQQKGGSRAD